MSVASLSLSFTWGSVKLCFWLVLATVESQCTFSQQVSCQWNDFSFTWSTFLKKWLLHQQLRCCSRMSVSWSLWLDSGVMRRVRVCMDICVCFTEPTVNSHRWEVMWWTRIRWVLGEKAEQCHFSQTKWTKLVSVLDGEQRVSARWHTIV